MKRLWSSKSGTNKCLDLVETGNDQYEFRITDINLTIKIGVDKSDLISLREYLSKTDSKRKS